MAHRICRGNNNESNSEYYLTFHQLVHDAALDRGNRPYLGRSFVGDYPAKDRSTCRLAAAGGAVQCSATSAVRLPAAVSSRASFMHATVHSRTRQARPSLVRPHNVFGLIIYQQGRSAPLALLIHKVGECVCLYLPTFVLYLN